MGKTTTRKLFGTCACTSPQEFNQEHTLKLLPLSIPYNIQRTLVQVSTIGWRLSKGTGEFLCRWQHVINSTQKSDYRKLQFSSDDSTAKTNIPDRSLQLLEVRMTHRTLTSHLITLILLFFRPYTQLERKSFADHFSVSVVTWPEKQWWTGLNMPNDSNKSAQPPHWILRDS